MAKDKMDDDLEAAVDKATGLVDLKMTKAELKKRYGGPCAPDSSDGPAYDYGLELHLETESLAKLGIKSLPGVGSRMKITAEAVVESVREEETQRNGKKTEPRRNVTLQIQKMAVNPAKKS